MNKKLLVIIVVIVAVVAGILYFRGGSAPSSSPTPSVSMYMPSMTPTATPNPTAHPSTSKMPTPSPTSGIIIHESQVFTVKIENFAFSPASLTVKQGDVVVFKNMDATIHTATALNGAFDSGTIGTGQQWTLATANLAPGTYAFHCSIHQSMQGTLVVQ